MPFDAMPDVNTKPSLAHLSHVLRHRELWPAGFVWDYLSCSTCAMGLAWKLYKMHRPFLFSGNLSQIVRTFGMDRRAAIRIFGAIPVVHAETITPEHVADAIDQYLATQ